MDAKVTINISGEIFQTYEDTLARFPTTLLGDKRRRRKYYSVETKQYFLERNRLCFEPILFFYQSNGTLNCPIGISIALFEQECKFFRLPREFIYAMKRKEGIFTDLLRENRTVVVKHMPFCGRVWNVLDNPDTSTTAWYYGLTSLFMVVVSIVTAAMETVPEFHLHPRVWATMELGMNIWFLTEIILRLAFTKRISKFFKCYLNVVDVISIVPYFLLLIDNSNIFEHREHKGLTGFLQTLKFLRVCRLFRFSKHSKRLAVTGKILKACWRHFRLLLLCWFIVITMGSTIMHVVEDKGNPDAHSFNSIPETLWWGVQTITSVGYGDCVPRTLVGRLFACVYMLLGVATISLPILTIVNQFVRIYPKNIRMESNATKDYVGGADDGGKLHLLRSMPPIRRPSPNRYQAPM